MSVNSMIQLKKRTTTPLKFVVTDKGDPTHLSFQSSEIDSIVLVHMQRNVTEVRSRRLLTYILIAAYTRAPDRFASKEIVRLAVATCLCLQPYILI